MEISIDTDVAAIVSNLQQKVRVYESASRADDNSQQISTGCPEFDQLLPNGGFTRGTLIEWLSAGQGSGAGMLAMLIARQAAQDGGAIVVLDHPMADPDKSLGNTAGFGKAFETGGQFHAPALVRWGIDLSRLIVVRAENTKDQLWALDQALRCRGVAAAWISLQRIDARSFRRLQLAAEEGGSLGLLLRPANVRGQPSWSDMQLMVRPQMNNPAEQKCRSASSATWLLQMEHVRSRSPAKFRSATFEVDTARGLLRMGRMHCVSEPPDRVPNVNDKALA